MIKWRPWVAAQARCFRVKVKLHCLDGISTLLPARCGEPGMVSSPGKSSGELNTMTVNVKWKGPRGTLRSRFKRSQKRARTSPKISEDNTVVTWNEEFEHTCMLTLSKDGCFSPWDICFVVNQVNAKSKSTALGSAWINVAKFVPVVENTKQTVKAHILTSSGTKTQAILVVTVDILELRTLESNDFDNPMSSCIGGPILCTADKTVEGTAVKQQNVKDSPLKGDEALRFPKAEFVSDSSRDSADSDSTFDWDDEEGVDSHQEPCTNGYGSLSGVNLVVGGALSGLENNENITGVDILPTKSEFSNRGDLTSVSDVDQSRAISIPVEAAMPLPRRNILSWRKRKLKFGSSRHRGEPLLNKNYGEDGGDDIDFARRLETGVPIKTSGIEETVVPSTPECIDFGDEHFVVGSWERKAFLSRDGQTKLEGDVFFATIDQRSERAAGESACTALVAVIAAWLHQNPGRMPIKAELDTLIREGSAEWRDLCTRADYKDLFADGHFDFDTVINAKVRPLLELAEKSYVGFFLLNGFKDGCDYLQGAMSFDSIWEEIIAKQEEEVNATIYVVSWNDHFFILKVDAEACYIIDTLGERLFEGSSQAYILRFDNDTRLSYNLREETDDKPTADFSSSVDEQCKRGLKQDDPVQAKVSKDQAVKEVTEGFLSSCSVNRETIFSGRESCKEFIKGFFAALPLRELQRDMRKGLQVNILHRHLQIEFHYTSLIQSRF